MLYVSVSGSAERETVIEKSRFIAYISHVSGEEEARAFLTRVRKEHPLATHVCWAYVADGAGNMQRYSDDGEPQGTAGIPILGVLKAQKLCETAIAVVRYFGGVKLGAGGLTRAYSGAAADVCGLIEKCEYDDCVKLNVQVEYPQLNALNGFLDRRGVRVMERQHGKEVVCLVAVREREEQAFRAGLIDALRGRVIVGEKERCRCSFPCE